jgi:hypothetical protein
MEYVSGNTMHSGVTDTRGTISTYDRYYKIRKMYFFIDRYNKLHKANKPSLMRLFRSHKSRLTAYLQGREIDFNDEHHLIELLSFCTLLKN